MEKKYKLTEKGKKLLKKKNPYKEIGDNMEEFCATILGFNNKDNNGSN